MLNQGRVVQVAGVAGGCVVGGGAGVRVCGVKGGVGCVSAGVCGVTTGSGHSMAWHHHRHGQVGVKEEYTRPEGVKLNPSHTTQQWGVGWQYAGRQVCKWQLSRIV